MSDLNIALILKLIDQVSGPARKVRAALGDIDKVAQAAGGKMTAWGSEQVAASKARTGALLGETAAAGAMAAGFVAALQPAIRFEEAMAGVNKVMEFEHGDAILKLGKDISDLTSKGRLPMAADQVADIAAAAGQAGLIDFSLGDDAVRAQAIAFARDAAQMGVAFDLAGELAGASMADLIGKLKLTRDEMMVLGDATNHLSNNMNATAADVVNILGRSGAQALSTGLNAEEVAALSAAFRAAAPSAEIAATGMKNFINALTKGEAATDAQEQVYAAIGLDPVAISERMVTDAKGTINMVLEGIRALPAAQQNAATGMLFGEEGKAAITPLVQSADILSGAFDLVADRTGFAGSMLAEYEVRAGTTANNQQLLLNTMNALAVTIGTTVLPAFNDLLNTIMPLVSQITDWAAANPELVSTILKVTAGLVALKVAATLLSWPVVLARLALGRTAQVAGFATMAVGKLATVIKLGAVIGFHVLRIALGGVLTILGGLAKAALAHPVIALVAAVAGAAWLIYDNWDQVMGWLMRKVDAVRAAFDEGLLSGVLQVLAEFNPFTLMVEAAGGLLGKLGEIIGLPQKIVDAFYAMDLAGAGIAMITSLRDGALSVVGAMVDAIKVKLEAIVPSWMQSAWAWVSGGAEDPQARATGGAFSAGALLVGERGPELRYASEGGYIAHHGALQRMVGLASRARDLMGDIDVGALGRASGMLDTRPALVGGGAAASGMTLNVGGITITAAPGMDPQAIGREVARQLREVAEEARHVLHDGGGR